MWAETTVGDLMPIKAGRMECDVQYTQFDAAAASFPWPQFCEKLKL